MNAPSSVEQTNPPAEPVSSRLAVEQWEEIDRSARVPAGFLFTCGLLWLIAALFLGLIASIKLHAAGFISNVSWLTYGRVYPAANNALLYGFAIQAALGAGLWMLARLCRARVAGAGMIVLGGVVWNLGLLLGIVGILAGHTTGYAWLELPRYATPILFSSYLVMGACLALTFHLRAERRLYPTVWFIVAALLWFPWIYSTAQLLLLFSPVRGALQGVVNGWYQEQLLDLWFTPIGLAGIFYFIPKLLGRPLYSRQLAVFAFWLIAILGPWGGIHAGAPVPKWVSSVSIVAGIFMIVPLAAIALNLYHTLQGEYWGREDLFRFFVVSAASFLLSSLLSMAGMLRTVSEVTQFTIFYPGVLHLYLFGFFGMAISGAVHFILPRVCGTPWPSPDWVRWHFWGVTAGTAIGAVSLIIGGFVHGAALNNPEVPVVQVARRIIPFLGMNTLAMLLLLAAYGILLANMARLFSRCCCQGDPELASRSSESRGSRKGGRP